jgi:transposase
MRGEANPQTALFSYMSLEERVPREHPLRKMRILIDAVLGSLDAHLGSVYATRGRPSIPPEFLLRASLIQILYTVRSERQLVEQIEFNLLFRWFVGLGMDDRVWDHSTFSHNRERLFDAGMARAFFERVRALAEWQELISDEHFSVDGSLIEAWASHKSFQPRDPEQRQPPNGGVRNAETDFRGQRRSNATHASLTDPDARLYRKRENTAAVLCHMGHVLMDNRHGLIVDLETTQATGTAERAAALRMLKRSAPRAKTVGADKGYDTADFIAACRTLGVTPHVAAKRSGSALDGRTTRHATYTVSLRIRKRIESIFGWLKTVADWRKTKLIGTAKVAGQNLLSAAAYNLVRMASLNGWWDARHT